jgi:hypothetical protein
LVEQAEHILIMTLTDQHACGRHHERGVAGAGQQATGAGDGKNKTRDGRAQCPAARDASEYRSTKFCHLDMGLALDEEMLESG